jgi:type II secretory pathway pseudopilin PulG
MRRKHKGFSLAEAMLALVILGFAVSSVLFPFTSGAKVRSEGTKLTLAAKLANDLMEEIIKTPFAQIISNYNGYTEAQGQVKDASGAVFSDLNYLNYSRDAECAAVYVPQEGGEKESKFIRITVRVYYLGEQVAVLDRLVSK